MKLNRSTLMLTLLHPLVDFCSVTVLVSGGVSFNRWLAYNFLAFALQGPLGALMDTRPGCLKAVFALACSLVTGGVLMAFLGGTGILALVLVCLGNALFHLSAGKYVLDAHEGKSFPIGLFISTGALGLMVGEGTFCSASCHWALGASALLLVGLYGMIHCPSLATIQSPADSSPRMRPLLVILLSCLVVGRSWMALRAGGLALTGDLIWLVLCAGVTFWGKVGGGFIAEVAEKNKGRPALWLLTIMSIIASTVFYLALQHEPWLSGLKLILLFTVQFATAPVLTLLYEDCGRRAGTAFGINCLALFIGSIV